MAKTSALLVNGKQNAEHCPYEESGSVLSALIMSYFPKYETVMVCPAAKHFAFYTGYS